MSRKSKFLALVLRHNPDLIGLKLDECGWARIDDLLKGCADHGVPFKYTKAPFTKSEIIDIVAQDDKGRFELGVRQSKIRAVHGHSIDVVIDLPNQRPPKLLYHGTTGRFLDSIFSSGLLPMNRKFVHLSETYEQALNVGSRHGKPVLLGVDAEDLHKEGQFFGRSSSGVWLTPEVPKGYFKVLGDIP